MGRTIRTLQTKAVIPTKADRDAERLIKAGENLGRSIDRVTFDGRHRLTHEVIRPIEDGHDALGDKIAAIGDFTSSITTIITAIESRKDNRLSRSDLATLLHESDNTELPTISDLINSEMDPLWIGKTATHAPEYVKAHADALTAARGLAVSLSGVLRIEYQYPSLRELNGYRFQHIS